MFETFFAVLTRKNESLWNIKIKFAALVNSNSLPLQM